jgi:hypothetical protein
VIIIPFLLLGIPLYFLPSIIAAIRRHPESGQIFKVNLLGGWSILGWISAMIWASIRFREKPSSAGRHD